MPSTPNSRKNLWARKPFFDFGLKAVSSGIQLLTRLESELQGWSQGSQKLPGRGGSHIDEHWLLVPYKSNKGAGLANNKALKNGNFVLNTRIKSGFQLWCGERQALKMSLRKKKIILLCMLGLNDFDSHTHICVPQKGLGSKYKVFILRLILHFSILEQIF